MSEFSDCYFLQSDQPTDVVALLKCARRYGLVLPHRDGWIPFLVDGISDAGGTSQAIMEKNPGVLLHYAYAEDHGLTLTVYDGVNESFDLHVQRRGPSEIDEGTVRAESARLQLVRQREQLGSLLTLARSRENIDVVRARKCAADAFGLHFLDWTSCADLTHHSERELAERFPGGRFVLTSRRGKAEKELQPAPNEWCPVSGLPAFMYLPLPPGGADESKVERHVHHWVSTGDFDDARQAGFWMLTAYGRALPPRYRFLGNRVMNLPLAFPKRYRAALRDTIRAILAVSPPDFDWEPYFERKAGEVRL